MRRCRRSPTSPAAYDLIAVAFADADASKPGGITFNLDSAGLGGYTVAQFKADIAAKQAAGKKVILSVGGQNGTISVADPTAASNFASSALSVLREYGFDGIDIDLENGVNAQYMGQALRSLHSQFGSGLVITMAPQTIDMQSTSFEYFKLALAIKDILTIVNVQYYNSGSMNGCDGQVYSQGSVDFITAQACIMLQGGLRPDQVGLGLAGVVSSGRERVRVADCGQQRAGLPHQRHRVRELQAERPVAVAAWGDDLVDQLGRVERQPVRDPGRRPRALPALIMHSYRPAPLLEALGVCSEDEQLYRALLARPESTATSLALSVDW